MHTRLGQRPDFLYHEGEYTIASDIPGSITITNPPAGKYYISIPTTSSYEGVDLVAITPSFLKIDATSGPNGSISPNAMTTVSPGDSVAFTASPNTGYIVDRWYKNGVEIPGSEETLSLTLSDIQEDATILVTFKSTGSSSQVYVAGSLNPSSISFVSLAAGGSGRFCNIPVQNRSSSTISVNANLTGDTAGWASMTSGNSSFTLA